MDRRIWHEHYDEGVPRALDYKDLTVPQMLQRSAERFPDRTAVVFFNATLTYRQLQDAVDRLATALTKLGVEPGSRVAVHLPNLPQTVIAYYAILACGAQVVMTNPLYVAREVESQWKDAGCRVAVTADFLYERVVQHVRDAVGVKHVLVASVPEYLRFPLKQLAPFKLRRQDPPAIAPFPKGEGVYRFRALIDSSDPAPPGPAIDPADVAVLQYTGGTTGVSKAAMLSHRNLVCNVQQCLAWMPFLKGASEVFLGALPYFHIFGMTIAMNEPLAMGATLVLIPNPRDIEALLAGIHKHRVTVFAAVPAMLGAMVGHEAAGRMDLSSVKAVFSGSAPLPEDTRRRFEEKTGARIFEGFGMTESSPATHANPVMGKRKTGTVGLPFPDTDCRIVDLVDGTKELPVGQEGELAIRGPQVMLGYWNKPEETAVTLRDGWLHSGDLAVMDEEGYFRIVGRKKDMILASGYNVFPDEIDNVLNDHPAVAESCTIGVPDEKRGETVRAFVVIEVGAKVTEGDLEVHCREFLAAYKVPRVFSFRDELPKSAMMKLLRRTLRDEVIEEQDRRRSSS